MQERGRGTARSVEVRPKTGGRLLVVDDEANLRKVLGAFLRRQGYEVETAQDGHEALECLSAQPFSVVLTDLRMPKMDGLSLLRRISERWPGLPVIVITAHGAVDSAVEAMKRGAFDFITKPYDQDELGKVVAKAVAEGRLAQSEARSMAELGEQGRFGLLGTSAPMRTIYDIIEKVADTQSTVLITGESGTGKGLVARALHEQSGRSAQPFIKLNCAAIPLTLMEAELFGHERGAFTGAVTARPGRFELADKGTLFLDEIGEIGTEMQVKLLRVIQDGEFERVGGVATRKVDVRLVAATNRNLVAEVQAGRFREDLYYRLNVVPVELPPLRARPDDIPLLVEALLARYGHRLGRPANLEPEALRALLSYDWPGNIRELENVLERTLLLCGSPTIDLAALPLEVRGRFDLHPEGRPPTPVGALKDAVREKTRELERDLIERALIETGGNVTHAARRLEISRKSLQTKMKELGLRDEGES